jgi:hypothetical protein
MDIAQLERSQPKPCIAEQLVHAEVEELKENTKELRQLGITNK